MSEKQQHTAAWTQAAMLNRYGTTYHHKHDKRHTSYRFHCRSHLDQHKMTMLQHRKINGIDPVGLLNIFQKTRKRLEKIMYH